MLLWPASPLSVSRKRADMRDFLENGILQALASNGENALLGH